MTQWLLLTEKKLPTPKPNEYQQKLARPCVKKRRGHSLATLTRFLDFFDHLPTPGWHLWRNSFKEGKIHIPLTFPVNVRNLRKNSGIISIAPKMCCVLSQALYFEFYRPWTLQCSQSQLTLNRTQFQNFFFRIVFGTFFGQWEICIWKKATFNTYLPGLDNIVCECPLPLKKAPLIAVVTMYAEIAFPLFACIGIYATANWFFFWAILFIHEKGFFWLFYELPAKPIHFLHQQNFMFTQLLKFIYSEKATKFWKIFTILLTVCTVVKSKVKISRKFLWPSQNIWTLRGSCS